ncbi:MAG: alpha/beta hydrolase [Bifidobacteriaceae bacterium]|nr:alpha/beta hydrolase [Bifidobacteriaceae bacterium]
MFKQTCQLGGLVTEISGSGRTVILLHGNGADAREWDAVASHLKDFRLVVPEARGHGRTPLGNAPLTIRAMADDLAKVIAEVGRQSVIVGFSDGANLALDLASRRTELFQGGLIVLGANLFPTGLRPFTWLGINLTYWLMRLGGCVQAKWRNRATVWSLMINQPRIDPAALGHLKCPSLVVTGQNDMIRQSHSRLIAQSLPGAELIIVPRQGHFLPTQASKLVADLISQFIHWLGPVG